LTASAPELTGPASTRTRRDRYERRQRRRSIGAATTSTVVVVGLLV
jgi:hypothetical protein